MGLLGWGRRMGSLGDGGCTRGRKQVLQVGDSTRRNFEAAFYYVLSITEKGKKRMMIGHAVSV